MEQLFFILDEVALLMRRSAKSLANSVTPRTGRVAFCDGTGIDTVKIGGARVVPRVALEKVLGDLDISVGKNGTPPQSADFPRPGTNQTVGLPAIPKRRGRPRKSVPPAAKGGQ